MRFTHVCRLLMILALFCCAGLKPARAVAETLPRYEWNAVGPFNGAVVLSLAADQAVPSTVYAGLDGGGVYKSLDGGGTWQKAGTGIDGLSIYALAIDPQAGATVYAGTNNGLYKTLDGGANWYPANAGNTDVVLSLAINGANIYAGNTGGVFRSSDGGGSWSQVTSLNGAMVQSLTVNTLGHVFAGTTAGVFKSINGGATWAAQNSGLSHLNVQCIAANPANGSVLYAATWGGGIYKTTDGGTTWAPTGSGITSPYVLSLSINPLLPDTVYAGTNSGAFRTTTGGSNWSLIAGIPTNVAVYAMTATPLSPATVFAGSNKGTYKSVDGGLNWFLSNTGITSLNVQAVTVNPVNRSTVYAGANGGMFRSMNRGTAWESIASGLGSLNVHAVAGHSSNQYLLYAATESGVFRSVNGGTTWSSYSNGLGSLSVFAIILDPALASNLYAGTDAGVYRSTNGGITWSLASNGITDLHVRSLAMHPSDPQTLYAGTVNGLFKTADGGTNWLPASGDVAGLAINALAIDPSSPETVFAATNSGIFRSNGGNIWEPASTGVLNSFAYALLIDPTTTPSLIYAGTEGGVFFSTNGGDGWTSLNGGLGNLKVHALAFDPSMHTLYAGTWGGGVFRLPAIDVTVAPAPFDFGNVPLNTVSGTQEFVLSNTNSYAVGISAITLSGTNSSMFQLGQGTCPGLSPTLLPGQSCAVALTFSPGQLGASSAILNILSNSINYPVLSVQLSGTGIVQAFSLSVTTAGTGSGRITLPSGTVCSGSCSEAYTSGTTVELTAAADIDSTFVNWSGCDSITDGICRVVMNGAKAVSATFDKVFQLAPLYPWAASGLPGISVYSLASPPASPDIVIAGTATGIYRSTNKGLSWTPGTGAPTTPVRSVAIDPATPTVMYAGAQDGVYKSTDGGLSWALISTLTGTPDVRALAIDPATPATIYAGTSVGLFRSSDSGANWETVPAQPGNAVIRSLAIDPLHPATLYAGTGSFGGGVYKSIDSGSSWTTLQSGGMYVLGLAIDPTDSNRVYAACEFGDLIQTGGVIVSNDGGSTWTNGTGTLDEPFRALAFDPGTGIIYAGSSKGILASFDNGVTWSRFETGLSGVGVFSLVFTGSGPGNLLAGTQNGVWRTTFADIAVSPESNDFLKINLGKGSLPQAFQIANTGTGALVIDSISVTGNEASVFDLEPGTCGTLTPTLDPGASCQVSVTFSPDTEGLASATLRIHSNAPAASLKLMALSGEGVIPKPDGFVCINDPNCRMAIIGSTSSPNVTLYITPYDYASQVTEMRFSNDNSIWSMWEPYQSTRPWILPTGDGTKTVYIELRNEAGLVNELPLTAKIFLNSQPPVATITSMPVGNYSSSAGTFSFTADQIGSSFECKIDSGNFLPCSSPFSFSGLLDGSHSFAVRATNAAGILQTTPSSYTWVIDTVAPDTSITSGPANGSFAVPATFVFTSPESGMNFQCSVDGGAYVSCSSPHTTGSLTAGTHTYRIRAVDLAGNPDPEPAVHTWSVVPPTTSITSKPANPANSTSATFEFTSAVPGATFECSLDFGAYAACISPATFTNLGIGSHSFSVRAKDGAGNYDTTPPRYSWTILYGPVKVAFPGGDAGFHDTLTGAFASISTGTVTVLAQNQVFIEDPVVFNADAVVTFKGGYDSAFGTVVGTSSIRGSLVIQNGTLEVANLIIM